MTVSFNQAVFNHINTMLENSDYPDATVEQFATFATETFDFDPFPMDSRSGQILEVERKAKETFTAHLAQEALELLDGVNRRSLLLILQRIEPAIEGYGVG